MKRVKVTLSYDGTAYCGWQRQAGLPTIQQTLENTFEKITGEKIHVMASGRTDTGVHALEQVAHCDISTLLSDDVLVRALNSQLPRDIVVTSLRTVSPDFHSQRQVKRKIYMYKILNTPLGDPLLRHGSWWIPKPLQIEHMNEAAKKILGEHDFKAFQNRGTLRKTTVRKIYYSEFKEASPFIIYEVHGNGFLKQMIRNLVGFFVKVGKGYLPPEHIELLLEKKDRRLAPPPAPPQGLYLKQVEYYTDELPS